MNNKEQTLVMVDKQNQLIEEVVRSAVTAATQTIDARIFSNFRIDTCKSNGPCGDRLAGELHRAIESAVREQLGAPK